MYRAQSPTRKYEEYAYVLDFDPRGKSSTIRGKNGIIITAIGEDGLTLLEILGIPNSILKLEKKFTLVRQIELRFYLYWGKWNMIIFHHLPKVNYLI